MEHDNRNALGARGTSRSTTGSLIAKVGAIVIGGALLVGGLIVSIAFFAVALAVALIAFGYFWWKTRAIRRQMREHLHAQAHKGSESISADVIEGVVLSRTERHETARPQRDVVDGRPTPTRRLE